MKSHKTAKDFFGKAWSKTRDFWRSLEKGLEGAFIPPPLAPSHQRPLIERDRHREERSDEATRERHVAPGLLRCAGRSSAKSGLSARKSGRPFHPKGPAGGWCGTGSGELWIFLHRNRIICQVENSLYLDCGSAMNASLLKCVVKSGGPSDALQERQRNAVRRRPKCGRKGADEREKFGMHQRTFGSLVTL